VKEREKTVNQRENGKHIESDEEDDGKGRGGIEGNDDVRIGGTGERGKRNEGNTEGEDERRKEEDGDGRR